MKIAIVILKFPPRWLAGAEILTYNVAKYLAKNKHEVNVVTGLDEGLPQESLENNFYIHRIKYPKIKYIGLGLFCLKSLLPLKKINSDLIFIQGVPIGLIGFFAKILFRKKYIVWCQGSDVFLPWMFKKIISKISFDNSQGIIVTSEIMKNKIRKDYPYKDIFVVHYGVDSSRFENLSKTSLRDKFKIPQNKKIIIFLGRLHPVKGVKYLIEAMSIIKKVSEDINLMIVGAGEEETYLKNLVKEFNIEGFVSFIGQVPNVKVPEYTAIADIVVLPSVSEGALNMEMIASGLPIVATKVGGLPEFIKNGENGFLVEPKNPKDIAEKVLLILGNNQLREKMSKNNREKVKEYSWENVINELEKVCCKICK